MRVHGDARQGAAGLALAAGADDHQPVVGDVVDIVFRQKRRQAFQIAALAGRGVHVVTVNDYLAARDAEWMGRVYR